MKLSKSYNIYDCHRNCDTKNFSGTEWVVDGENGRMVYPGDWSPVMAKYYYVNGWSYNHPFPCDDAWDDDITVYTIAMKERGDDDMDIWTTSFTSREKADAFVEKVFERLKKYGMDGQWQISIDSGKPDDEMYLDWIDARYEEYGEEDE